MIVVKRDGQRKMLFNKSKIVTAIGKAMAEVGGVDLTAAGVIADNIETEMMELCSKEGRTSVTVEEIQDAAEMELMRLGFDKAAKAYILYRDEHNRMRGLKDSIIEKVLSRTEAKDVQNSNANVDEKSFSGREKEASADIQKEIALEINMSYDVAKAHKDGWIYQHDLDKFNIGEHNCLFADFEHVFKNGFTARNGDVRPPGSLSTACQQLAVIMQCSSQVQFGGVASAHVDYDLAPFVRKSYYKHFADGLVYLAKFDKSRAGKFKEEVENICLDDFLSMKDMVRRELRGVRDETIEDVLNYAIDMLEREGVQAFEALAHNLNTLESRAGSQVPFTSLNTGRDTSWEGRFITRHLFEAGINGIGKHRLTSIFPISIFQYKSGCNADKGDMNYDLKKLALEAMSKRIYPNFVNCDWSQAHEDPSDKDTFFATINNLWLDAAMRLEKLI